MLMGRRGTRTVPPFRSADYGPGTGHLYPEVREHPGNVYTVPVAVRVHPERWRTPHTATVEKNLLL